MFAAWLVIIPLAIFIVRFGRNIFLTTWFKLHVGTQVLLSIPVILAGSSLSFVAAGSILKFDDPHQVDIITNLSTLLRINSSFSSHKDRWICAFPWILCTISNWLNSPSFV